MIVPTFLQPGDRVALVSPSSKVPVDDVKLGIQTLESWGLNVLAGTFIFEKLGSLAGSDVQRIQDLQSAISDPTIKAIFCTRGGYGLTRIVDQLDWSQFLIHPKWIIGYSDATALLLAASSQNVASIHGPMAVHLAKIEQAEAAFELKEFLFGRQTNWTRKLQSYLETDNREVISGKLVGGNLTLLVNELETNHSVPSEGNLLFIEEIGEPGYKVDRMLVHLARCGKLQSAKAIVLGHFTDCEPGEFPFSPLQSIHQLVDGKVPIFSGMPSGHESPSMPFVHGFPTQIFHKNGSWLLEQRFNSIEPNA